MSLLTRSVTFLDRSFSTRNILDRFVTTKCHLGTVAKKEYKGHTQSFGKLKKQSKRLLKKYKLKTHQGAAARWMVMGDGVFKRGQAGRNHFNRKMSSNKRRSKKSKVISTATQTRRLKKLLPYFKKKYMK